MTFVQAIRQLNDGKLIAREHWPRGCYVGLVVSVVAGQPRAFLAARAEDGRKTPWIAADDDCGASDWREAMALTGEDAERARQRRIHHLPEG